MKTKILSILIITILFFSCKTDKKEEIILKPNKFTNIQIEVLNGEKWVVDKPMMDIIVNIKKDVMQFDGKTLEDYNNLSNKIKKHLDVLTSSCTMTGQGHDELHKWLLPFLDISKEFAKSKTLKDAQENYQVIKHSFGLVDENFK
jgi:hypothetical protein